MEIVFIIIFSFILGGEVEHKVQQENKAVESGLIKTAENRQ